MADGKDRKPDADDIPRNDGGAKTKSSDERGARAAKAGTAQGEKNAAQRLAKETSDARRSASRRTIVLREAEERRRGQAA
jgi:hypothetical protein